MIGPLILIFGSYLAVSPGVDLFLYPKMLCIVLGAAICLWRTNFVTMNGTLSRPFFFMIAAAAASAMLSESPLQSVIGPHRSPTEGLVGLLACLAAYEAGLTETVLDVKKVIAWAAATCAAVALVHLLPGSPFHGLIPGGRAIGTIGSPPYLGCMLALAIPMSGPWIAGLLTVAIIATKSKAAILGVACGAYALFARKNLCSGMARWKFLIMIASPLLIALISLNRGKSDMMRIYIWEMGWKAFIAHPIFGWGPENFVDAFMRLRDVSWIYSANGGIASNVASENSHNLILNVAATGGLLGLATHGYMATMAALRANEMFGQDVDSLIAAYASVLAYSMFNPVPFMAWCVLAFFAGTVGI